MIPRCFLISYLPSFYPFLPSTLSLTLSPFYLLLVYPIVTLAIVTFVFYNSDAHSLLIPPSTTHPIILLGHQEIIVVFRGTSNAHDLLTDLHCSTASFEDEPTASFSDEHVGSSSSSSSSSIDDRDMNIDGVQQQPPQPQPQSPSPQDQQVHAGFLRTVKSLDATLLPRILDLLHQPYPSPSSSSSSLSLSSSSSSSTSSSSSSSSLLSSTGSPLSFPSSPSLLQRGYRVTCLGYSFGAAGR